MGIERKIGKKIITKDNNLPIRLLQRATEKEINKKSGFLMEWLQLFSFKCRLGATNFV